MMSSDQNAVSHASMSDEPTSAGPWGYVVTYVILLLLLGVSVVAGEWSSQRWSWLVALAIATLKAILIVAYFMHLRHSRSLIVLTAASSLLFLAILLGFGMADYLRRSP